MILLPIFAEDCSENFTVRFGWKCNQVTLGLMKFNHTKIYNKGANGWLLYCVI